MTSAHAELWVELCERYREPARHYHTLEHVAELLGWLEHLRGRFERPALVAWAIWFHDAVYDPLRRDNEARSAALARARLPAIGLSGEECDAVAEMVMATADHHANEARGDVALFLDLDLSILGTPERRYDAYCAQVRSEYGFVAEDVFREKRAQLLEGWSKRPRLYFSEVCHGLFEEQARVNLRRELDGLGGSMSM